MSLVAANFAKLLRTPILLRTGRKELSLAISFALVMGGQNVLSKFHNLTLEVIALHFYSVKPM